MDTNFQENIFVKVHVNSTDTMLVGLVYRSDSGSQENHYRLNELITEACRRKQSHYVIMGDS
jgi:hypothetical protein